MATFIPKIDQPVEGVPHPKWLQGKIVGHDDELRALQLANAEMRRALAAIAKQLNALNIANRNNRARIMGTGGVPAGGLEGDRLGKLSDTDGDYDWVRNYLGGAELKYYNLPEEGDEVYLLDEYEAKFFDVTITSTADNEPYLILFPELLHIPLDVGTPFYVFSINVGGGHSVDLTLQGDVPTYFDHPGTFIMDTPVVADTGVVTLPSGFSAQWFVMGNIATGDARAIPLNDSTYTALFGPTLNASSTTPTVAATAAAGTGPTVTVTGTSISGVVELGTGTSPTTTGWGELLTFTNGWASGEVPVLALYPANQAAAALTHYGARSGTEAEAHFDLTGIAASTTYKFHYSLLPFAAV